MAQVSLHRARTTIVDAEAAAEDLLQQLGSAQPKLVVFFSDRDRDQVALNRAIRKRLAAGVRVVGATSAGEVDNEGFHTGSVVLSALSGDFEVGIGLGAGLSHDAVEAGARAVSHACDELGIRPHQLDSRRHVGLVIDDGFRYKKEELLLGVLDRNQSLILVGGGASDSNDSRQSAILHVDGEVATDAAIVALIQTDAPWAALRSHWYQPTGDTVRITKVDDTATRILEIDGKPAAKRYADILGVTPDDLEFGKPNGFAARPLAMKVGREHFIRAPWKVMDDGSILCANLLQEDSDLELMRMSDIVESTRRFFEEEVPQRVKSPQAALLFHCAGRAWFAESMGKTPALAKTFASAPPAVGLHCHFEIFSGFHINTTLTALVFGAND
ncbi:FIST signal transduction protein [Vulgatibacter incomptus]|nr:FIST N-terminal domain-containing protein [Vulgatibacter incomptus]